MEKEVVVIGTTFVDCKGMADGKNGKYLATGRNIGKIQFVHGGVGRNVAENLAGLGQSVIFVSTVDDSALGQEVLERLVRRDVDVDFVAKEKERGMGLWMVILDEKGEQVGSLSHVPQLDLLEDVLDQYGAKIMQRASCVALEIDLTESIAQKVFDLAQKYRKPVYALPGNLSIALARPDFLTHLAGFVCNHVEVGRLFQFDSIGLSPEELLEQVGVQVKKHRLSMLVVTMGASGAVYYDARTGEKGYVPAIPTKVKDVSGAGDAFFSGMLQGILQGGTLREAVERGTQLASRTIQTSENSSYASD